MAKFANALEQFEPIDRNMSNTDLMRIQEVVVPILLQIRYDETGGTNNLIGLIMPVAAYKTRYGAAFVKPTRVGAYEVMIDDNAMAVFRVCT